MSRRLDYRKTLQDWYWRLAVGLSASDSKMIERLACEVGELRG